MDIKITTVKNQDGTTITLEGQLNTITAQDLTKEFDAVLPDVTNLTIDMNDLEYISSAGLRLLVTAQKKMKAQGGKMKIINVNEMVNEVFEMTGLSGVFNVVVK